MRNANGMRGMLTHLMLSLAGSYHFELLDEDLLLNFLVQYGTF